MRLEKSSLLSTGGWDTEIDAKCILMELSGFDVLGATDNP